MKKIILSCLVLFINVFAYSQWVALSSGTVQTFTSVYFTDANTGYVVGGNGTILKTTDGGMNWIAQYSGTTGVLHFVHFTDKNTGYAGGDNGIILKTTDGGMNWIPLSTGTTALLRSIFFTNANTGYAVGGKNGIILKTINGGVNWIVDSIGTWYNDFYSVCFPDANTGYVVGYYTDPYFGTSINLKTVDGGATWTYGQNLGNGYLYSVYFTDVNTGYILSDEGILRTTNGGESWWPKGRSSGLYSIYFTDFNTGYAVGYDESIIKTIDGGGSWHLIFDGPHVSPCLNSVYFTDADTGYAVGWWGTILKTTNGGMNSIDEKIKLHHLFSINPNPANSEIIITYTRNLSEETSISIFTMTGELQTCSEFKNQNRFEIDVSSLRKGMYLVQLRTKAGIEVQKLLIQ